MHPNHSSIGSAGIWELWNPHIILITLVFMIVYFLFIGSLRHLFQDSKPVSTGRKIAFLSGLLIFYIAEGSPLSYYGHHYLFSAHMTQMALLFLIMPPLLYIGTPDWLLRPLLRDQLIYKLLNFLTHPLVAIISFNALFSFYHVPFIFDTVMSSQLLMNLFHGILLLAAFMMWWPVASPIQELNKLSELRKMAYIFADGVLLTPACALIIFANTILYNHYVDAPQLFAILDTMQDQQLGGVIMKLIQEVAYGCMIGYIFFQWIGRDKPNKIDRIEDVTNLKIGSPSTSQHK